MGEGREESGVTPCFVGGLLNEIKKTAGELI